MQSQTISIPCAACRRANLPGGVRCSYCGTPYPPALDFDLGLPATPEDSPSPSASAVTVAPNTTASTGAVQQGKRTGLFGSLVLLLLKGKSLLAMLKLGKVALTLSTMIISIGVYSRLYTWRFAIGFVICILIHELGHVAVFRRYKLKTTAPMFIPFVGALIFLNSFPEDPTIESEGGAGGPIAGALAAFVCVLIGLITHHPFWYALAASGFIINLFNLIPIMQLDGAHIISVFFARIWNGVMIAMLLIAIKAPVPMLWILLATNFMTRISQPASSRYLLARPRARLRMALVYMLLCVGLSYGIQTTSNYRGTEVRPELAGRRAVRRPQAADADNSQISVPTRTQAEPYVSSNPTHPALTFRNSNTITIVIVFLVTFGALAGILWTVTSYLLVRAVGLVFQARFLALAGIMVALFALAIGIEKGLAVSWHDFLVTLGAYFAATLAALIYAGYLSAQKGRKKSALPYMLPLETCLGWAGAGALLVAYGFDSWITAGIIGVTGLAFVARYPWLLVSKAAEWANDMGEHARADKWLNRALALTSEPGMQAHLWERLTRLYLMLEQGGAALESQNAKEALLTAQVATDASQQYSVNTPSYVPTLHDLEQRASALMLLDRYEDALACCERMLQQPAGTAVGPLCLFIVHMYLTRMALLRGWGDEALAQSDWCLRASAKLSPTLQARLHSRRAQALVMQGQVEAALQECRLAEKAATEIQAQAGAAMAEAQAHLLAGNAPQAEKDMKRALRVMPGNLQLRYWQARVLLAQGQTAEGREALSTLAATFPQEHWGRAAQSALALVQ